MGANFHVDIARLIVDIRQNLHVPEFIETGANVGETAEWASEHFEKVTTIELDDDLYDEALEKRGHIENLEFVKGASQQELVHIVPELDEPAVFHLDAHCGGKWAATAGESRERDDLDICPLLDELEVLAETDVSHYLFIDDARVFTSPRRRPFDMDEWPNLQEVIHALEAVDPDYEILIYKDEIIAVPAEGRDFVRQRIREFKSTPRTRFVRLKLWIMNKLWMKASLSGPVRDF